MPRNRRSNYQERGSSRVAEAGYFASSAAWTFFSAVEFGQGQVLSGALCIVAASALFGLGAYKNRDRHRAEGRWNGTGRRRTFNRARNDTGRGTRSDRRGQVLER